MEKAKFKDRLVPVDRDRPRGFCTVRKKDFSVSTGGVSAVHSHASGKIHRKYTMARNRKMNTSVADLLQPSTSTTNPSPNISLRITLFNIYCDFIFYYLDFYFLLLT